MSLGEKPLIGPQAEAPLIWPKKKWVFDPPDWWARVFGIIPKEVVKDLMIQQAEHQLALARAEKAFADQLFEMEMAHATSIKDQVAKAM